ncbi:hypothetical protein vseg_007497 [Gypsophila vaccaria]
MKAFRNAYILIVTPNINPKYSLHSLTFPKLLTTKPSKNVHRTFRSPPRNAPFRFLNSFAMGDGEAATISVSGPTIEAQFEKFRAHLDESSGLREKIRNVSIEIDSAARIMHAGLLLVHQSRPVAEVLERSNSQIDVIKKHYSRLAEILKDCPDQYYRYHNDWRSETQTVVSLLTFMHWLETGVLLMHHEAQEKLGLNATDFGLDVEDYLVGENFRYYASDLTTSLSFSTKMMLNIYTCL